MKNKLFYQDPYIKEFTATLQKQEKDNSNGEWYAVLDKTAFYPEGGGQPFDTGVLNDITVVNVQEINDEIRHYLEAPLPEGTTNISGIIDWERRFDHMQQHAGQHLLSAAFEELFSYKTISFHLGKEMCTIDIATPELTLDEANKAEGLVNQIILENRMIETKWVSKEELSLYPLRKELSVKENIRLVIVPEYDYNGCGGTHPNSTAEVSALKIMNWEKQKKKVRITFICGNRVLKELHEKQKVISELAIQLNAPQASMVDGVKRLLEQNKELEKTVKEQTNMLLEFEADSILSEVEIKGDLNVIGKVFQNRTFSDLQILARNITNTNENMNVLLVLENNEKLQFVCARGKASEINMNMITKRLITEINGKGGGTVDFAQGGGRGTGDIVLQAFIRLVK
ncbi:alanyl-tRNA editing protein [Sutcliffiella rhizosphaerae]|uniref:Alanine--tRNA ligase n=1 Tax=Sutcliffiella rhizosphaerae TaxID=2880967 RepID=A0ABN8A4E2_9BACI|nr:DHHA1 domain-containing protein [Sutcliffiella rhizosphaerae]CAG9619534.1 Alanine--tRNA ligase [Sutcliffiella rhizosphaerae]